MSDKTKVFVAGHNGMAGAAILRKLHADEKFEVHTKARSELDLSDRAQVNAYFTENRFEQVYLAAAKVGGILANDSFPAEFLLQNLDIQNSVIQCSHSTGVKRLLFLGSSCIYPRNSSVPIPEDALLTGALETTNEAYALAKIAGLKLCEAYNKQYSCDFRSLMPTNLYGPGDNYHANNSHVIPALIRKFHTAKVNGDQAVSIWGTGTPLREFLHVDDLASAAVHVMSLNQEEWRSIVPPRTSHINIGVGIDISIGELARLIASIIGFSGKINFDPSKPDGTPRKLLDISKITSSGWKASISLTRGLESTYRHHFTSDLARRG